MTTLSSSQFTVFRPPASRTQGFGSMSLMRRTLTEVDLPLSGVITSVALGNGSAFRRGRDFAAGNEVRLKQDENVEVTMFGAQIGKKC